MDPLLASTALLSLAVWLYLLLLRGGFWRADRRLDEADKPPTSWPSVVALVPARDEEEIIAAGVGSLLSQDYPGTLTVVVIDDNSCDRTAAVACEAAANMGAAARLVLVMARPPSPGWTGKIWALNEGLAAARQRFPEAPYIWLSDADIAHGPRRLT